MPSCACQEPKRVLIVEDDVDVTESLKLVLEHHGFSVRATGEGEQAIEMALEFRPDVVLLDLKLPAMSGFLVAAKFRYLPWRPRVLVLTALPRGASDRFAAFLNVDRVLHKPVPVQLIVSAIQGSKQRLAAAA